MEGKLQLRKPEHWQDFERLCKILWGEIWECTDTIKRNGRQGQQQNGVDVYGVKKGEISYRGIQCKGKDDYTKSELTKEEIDVELEKARDFKPALTSFYFATTANKNARIEEYIREINQEYQANGLFAVDVFFWEDIVDLIEANQQTYNWYLNNCSYKDVSDVELLLNWRKEFTINPSYIRTTKRFKLRPQANLSPWNLSGSGFTHQELMEYKNKIDQLPNLRDMMCGTSTSDYTWCTLPFYLRNIGKTVIEDYKLLVSFDSNSVKKVSDRFYYSSNQLINPAMSAQINAKKDADREVFKSLDFKHTIEFIPKRTSLVQGDFKSFKVDIMPQNDVSEIKLDWVLFSRNYKKQGELLVRVEPLFEDEYKTILVDSQEEIKEDEIIISPKIVKY